MNTEALLADAPFNPEQKEYLQGFFAGIAFRQPFVGHLPNGQITSTPAPGLPNIAA
jgi:ferredoxin-nitrite reductase